jgi:class 3 adenylate cyclase/tetratricopeptide (TPR) repeat protein
MLFCDVTGSTAMGERLDPEAVRELMFQYFHRMRSAIERHGGTVEKFVGDAVMAVFGVPMAHEDDPLRAVRAAAEMRDVLDSLNEELEERFGSRISVRIGVETGEVVAGSPATRETFVTGDPVNVAARLEQAAAPGEILIGESTLRLVRDAVTSEPVVSVLARGKAFPVEAHRLLEVVPAAPATVPRLDVELVGRGHELAHLDGIFKAMSAARSCRVATIVGEPGVGKSRLAEEVIARSGAAAAILHGRCLPYGDGITYWPLVEAVREAAGIRDQDAVDVARSRVAATLAGSAQADLVAEQVARAIGLTGAETSAERIAWAVRKLFEAMAARRPLVVLIDDVHWAEPVFLDLIRSIESEAAGPILLLCLARPELLEERPEWPVDVHLDPLGQEELERLVSNLLSDAGLDDETRRRLAAAATGSPLFAQELVSMLVDDGVLERRDGAWVATRDLSTIPIPPTLQALLAARLDRLESTQRLALERGAVEGEVFHRGAVIALSDSPGDEVPAAMLELSAKEFIVPHRASFTDEAAYRFRHLLIRDAAYAAMPKRLRGTLHERFARWLEGRAGARVHECEEILGYHLERAYRYSAELGPVDERGAGLARAAAERLAGSGRRAIGRRDQRAAVSLLTRARDLLLSGDPLGAEVNVDLADALVDGGDFEQADRLHLEVIDAARTSDDEQLGIRATLRRIEASIHTGALTTADALGQVEILLPACERIGDDRLLAHALALAGRIRFWQGAAGEAERDYKRAVEHARRAGDLRRETETLAWLIGAKAHGSAPVDDGIALCDDVLARRMGDPLLEVFAHEKRGWLLAMEGRFDEARVSVNRAREITVEFGLKVRQGMTALYRASVEMLADGDLDLAERELRAGYELLESIGEVGFRSSIALGLARVLSRMGRDEEANRFAIAAQEDDQDPQVMSLQALLIARRVDPTAAIVDDAGDLDRAERLARRAVSAAETTDYLDSRGESLVDLAEVLSLSGRSDEARGALEEAVMLFDRKGNVISARKAMQRMATLVVQDA